MTAVLSSLPALLGLVLGLHPAAGPAALGPPAAAAAAPTGPAPASRMSPDPAVWPLSPRPDVVSGFSPPADPWGSGHRGVDLLGRVGQPVRSAQPGTVSYVGSIAGVGVVVVTHGATRSTYQPVSPSVHLGEHVTAGQVLGTLELFGSHCFPRACLHWGLLDGAGYLDPLSLLGAAPVRLLPLGTPGG